MKTKTQNCSPALFAKRAKVTHAAVQHKIKAGYFRMVVSKETGKNHIILDAVALDYIKRHNANNARTKE